MAEPQRETNDDGAARSSLLDQLRGQPPRLGGSTVRGLRIAGIGLLAALAVVAIIAGLLGRRAWREAVALGDRIAVVAASREADRATKTLFASPGIGDQLGGVAAHLPPGTRLALAARDGTGALSIAIDTTDPDALRQTLRADPWFAAFRERGQSAGENGALRVTFEQTP